MNQTLYPPSQTTPITYQYPQIKNHWSEYEQPCIELLFFLCLNFHLDLIRLISIQVLFVVSFILYSLCLRTDDRILIQVIFFSQLLDKVIWVSCRIISHWWSLVHRIESQDDYFPRISVQLANFWKDSAN